MGEDDIVELLCKSDQVVRSSQILRHSSDPPPILRGSGSGGGEGNAPLPQPPPPGLHHQHSRLFIQEDEMASWLLHHPHRQEYYFYYQLLSSVSMGQPPQLQPSAQYVLTADTPTGQIAPRRAENFMNFLRQRGNMFTGGVEAAPSMQVGSSATLSSSAIESCVIPVTEGTEMSLTLAVPGLGREEKVAIEIAGTKAIQIQTGTEIVDDRKRKEREETIAEVMGTEESRGSTSRKRSRTAEMHNLSERRRREKINEKMKALQELIPGCTKTNKASVLDDAIEYVKWLQMQMQMTSMGHGTMPPMMHMQQQMPHMATRMNRPPFIPFPGTHIPRPPHMAGLGPSNTASRYPFDPSRVQLRSPQSNPMSNQTQFPAYMNPYSQFVGLLQMQPPSPLQSQTTSQLSFGHASRSKEPDDQDNQSKV